MPEPRLTEEQISELLTYDWSASPLGIDQLVQALRQVRGDLDTAHKLLGETITEVGKIGRERDAAREQVRRLREAARAVLDADSRKPAQVWEAFDNLRAALAASGEGV